jgi:3',5'-cyclic AMP phosphodiesterase CpdA
MWVEPVRVKQLAALPRGALKGKRQGHVREAMKKWATSVCCVFGIAVMLLASCVLAGAVEPFFFIQLSDPQFGMFTGNKDFAQETANFEFAVATINRLRPQFVVITGDLVNKPGDAAQIAEFKRIAAKVDSAIPVYNVAGNHDVENVPTPDRITAYTNLFGPDHYAFSHGGLAGLVLNSSIIHSPQQTTNEYAAQEQWLRTELEHSRADGAQHIVIFQHHPWFLKTADEPDQYFNIPSERRASHLALFHEFGVKHLFSGHYHRNAVARDGDIEAVTTGPVGQPQGGDKSGLRVVIVRDGGLEHRYYHFGEMPTEIDVTPAKPQKTSQK